MNKKLEFNFTKEEMDYFNSLINKKNKSIKEIILSGLVPNLNKKTIIDATNYFLEKDKNKIKE